MKFKKIRVKNFKILQNVTLNNIPQFCVIIGPNGSGKTTLFDIFYFLKDCMTTNVTKALQKRGGFNEFVSRGHEHENITIEIQFYFKLSNKRKLATYILEIGLQNNKPSIVREILQYKRSSHEPQYKFLDASYGKGNFIINEENCCKTLEEPTKQEFTYISSDILALKNIGQFAQIKALTTLYQMIENIYIFNFDIDAAYNSNNISGEIEHLSSNADNLKQVALYLIENHPDIYTQIIKIMSRYAPGVGTITVKKTFGNSLELEFGNEIFKKPISERFISEGTLKLFAYLILLYDPKPRPFLCVEEPEHNFHPQVVAMLVDEFRAYSRLGGQVFISTHSREFLDSLNANEVIWLEKGTDYFSKICKAEENDEVNFYINDGDKIGHLWRMGILGRANPQ